MIVIPPEIEQRHQSANALPRTRYPFLCTSPITCTGTRHSMLPTPDRQALQWEAVRRAHSFPRNFRDLIRLGTDQYLVDQIQPWQVSDFEALDPAWCRIAGQSREPRFRRAYIERPRGHSKTSDMAIQIAWILQAARHPITGIAAAADREQAGLLLAAIRKLVTINPALCLDLCFAEGAIRNRRTGSRLDLISSDVASSYGILPDFVICDELSHWPRPELWYSLLSSAAKKPDCVLAVLTNAGVGRDWQWEVRENASSSEDWHFSSLDGPHAPWITQRSLEEQQALLPPAVYERLWLNRWQHSDGEFVSLAEAEACIDPALTRQDHGLPQYQYFGAIDYAEKRDYTAAVIMHEEGGRYLVDRMDVARPSAAQPTPVVWVEDWIQQAQALFPGIKLVLDDYQLAGTAQKYPENRVSRFRFSSGKGNHDLAVSLRHLILQRKVAWYPGCGTYPAAANTLWQNENHSPISPQDDLISELASLLLCQSKAGHLRIDHRSDAHDDRAFVLGVACLQLLSSPPIGQSFWKVTEPEGEGGCAWM